MNRKFYLDSLEPADRLVLPKSGLAIIQHHAIYIGKDTQGGRVYIENAIGKGVQVVSEAQLFRDDYSLTRIERFKGNESQRANAIKLALQLIGKPYDLFHFNCEHYANTVQKSESYSKQVRVGIGLGLLALILGFSLSK